jgi:DUF1680 family protein
LNPWFALFAALVGSGPIAWAEPIAGADRLQLLPVAHVQVRDSFWAPKLKVCRESTIPHSWFYMQWELRSLRHAAGQKVEGDLNGTWGEANLYKFLETAAYSLAQERDPALERQVDEVIALVAAGQQPDGYLHVYVTNNRKTPWDPGFLDGSHDGYVLGHLIEAAIEYHAATGKRAFLDLAGKAADQAWQHFLGPNGQPGFCGHAELEMALVELYLVTREPRYRDLSRAFVEWRGRGKVSPAGPTARAYFQDGAPLRAQRTLDMPVQRMMAHPNVASCRGQVALQRGPLVYGFEGIDNPDSPRVTLGANSRFTVECRPDLLGGVTVIRGVAENGRPIQAIPYYTSPTGARRPRKSGSSRRT